MMTPPNPQPDPLYVQARQILAANPGMGKGKLANLLGVRTPTSRRLIHRYLGETQGHASDPQYAQDRQLLDNNPGWGANRLAQTMSIPLDRAKVIVARYRGAQAHQAAQGGQAPPAPPADKGGHLQSNESRDNKDLSYTGDHITSLNELLVHAEVDERIWEIERHVVNKWEVGCRNPCTGEILVSPLWQIKVWLRRRVGMRIEDTLRQLLAEFAAAAPVRPPVPPRQGTSGVLEISIFDLHGGGYGNALETGAAYDLQITRSTFWRAMDDLLERARGLRPERILFPIGNDYYNVDGSDRATANGTPQDEAVRWNESFLAGRKLLVEAIEALRESPL